MRKKLLIVALLVSMAALAAAGTWAATTVDGRTTNVITTGGVTIAVNEYQEAEGALVDYPSDESVPVMPTRKVSKVVKVENVGESDAWVRVKFEVKFNGLPKNLVQSPEGLVALNMASSESWVRGQDGWWYYTEKLANGQETPASLQSVTFNPEMGNEYQNAQAVISVFAEAVQCAHNGNSYSEAAGWPSELAPNPDQAG